ncbi:hypothetical protein SAMN05216359_104283 [Roseateles sp. YR242]|uniref:hypothetical protein n=1 Tax=Roseateles sp. YR242 TaxID=1855305 RepID=UPI0008C353BD|nr:hypothetical protein [Roseateles sp. YR242]SEL00494.1 hypothetical protein SAMN05216359_104283 [Roseateles sp. YR242]
MDIGHTWMIAASAAAGLVAAGAGVSWWWNTRLGKARRLIEQLKASRDLLNQQNSQARRQIEQLQLELGELRIIAERVRRRAANTVSPPDTLGPPLEPRGASPLATQVVALAPRAPQASAGFVPTSYDEADDKSGFAPTQFDRSRGR